MIVSLDATSAVPLFEQLRSQIELLVVSGQLAVGTQLPAIRHLASDLSLARGTVAKVYEVLARDGLVASSGRHGTIVVAQPDDRRPTAFDDAVDQLARVARQLGLTPQEAHQALDDAFAREMG